MPKFGEPFHFAGRFDSDPIWPFEKMDFFAHDFAEKKFLARSKAAKCPHVATLKVGAIDLNRPFVAQTAVSSAGACGRTRANRARGAKRSDSRRIREGERAGGRPSNHPYLFMIPTKSRTVFSSAIENSLPSLRLNQNALDDPPSRLIAL